MILASYVRHCDDIPMEEQTKAIAEYCREHKLSISKKYSERSKDNEAENAFNKMKDDSVIRAFDAVIFYSFGTFGYNPFTSNDLLSNAFLPAGISFISVHDDYDSALHSAEENAEYLTANFKNQRRIVRARKTFLSESFIYQTFYVYGYILDNNRMVQIDDSVSEIVHEIFSRALAGEKHTEIAKDLNSRGVESPATHHLKLQGKPINKEYKWVPQTVIKILTSNLYAGERPTRHGYLVCNFLFQPYVSKADFEKVQSHIASYKKKLEKKPHIFYSLIFDKETGSALVPIYSKRKKAEIYQTIKGVKAYPENYLSLDCVIEEVNKILMNEKEQALSITAVFDTSDGKAKLNSCLQKPTVNMKRIYAEMLALVDSLMPTCVSEDESELKERMNELEEDFSAEYEKHNHYQKVFSADNPWIKLYSTYDPKYIYERNNLKKYIDKILLYRFQKIEVVLKEQDWKNVFQKEWMDN